MTGTLPAAGEPALTPPPDPSRPPAPPSEADREAALIWTMAGMSAAEVAADAAEAIARAQGLAIAMAELEAAGWTQESARGAIRANGGTAAGALRKLAVA